MDQLPALAAPVAVAVPSMGREIAKRCVEAVARIDPVVALCAGAVAASAVAVVVGVTAVRRHGPATLTKGRAWVHRITAPAPSLTAAPEPFHLPPGSLNGSGLAHDGADALPA